MRQAWRIVKEKYAAAAFSGEGAAKTGGRWNSRGVDVIYASCTKALAALENLVHLTPVRFKYVAIPIQFDETLVEIFPASSVPDDWKTEPPPPSTKTIGDTWVRQARSAVFVLPSIIIAGEPNYLINPAHPDFQKIIIGKPESFAFDPRLLEI